MICVLSSKMGVGIQLICFQPSLEIVNNFKNISFVFIFAFWELYLFELSYLPLKVIINRCKIFVKELIVISIQNIH